MPARRCVDCQLSYPVREDFKTCPKCKGETLYQMWHNPTPGWEDQVAAAAPEDELEFGDPVIAWRFGQLLRAGFSPIAAIRLAMDRSIDLHQTVELAAVAGPDMAYRIVA